MQWIHHKESKELERHNIWRDSGKKHSNLKKNNSQVVNNSQVENAQQTTNRVNIVKK